VGVREGLVRGVEGGRGGGKVDDGNRFSSDLQKPQTGGAEVNTTGETKQRA